MVLALLGAVGFIVALALVVPLLAYGLSALFDPTNWKKRGGEGDDGQGGLLVPRRPSPSGPPAPMTRSTDPGKRDGTVS